ncbi:hypothetical protein ACKWTF_013078 [Chironomus riparius]
MSKLIPKRNQDEVEISEETKRLRSTERTAISLKNANANKLEVSWVGIYSMDKDEYKNDMSSLKYLKLPKIIDFNLNESSIQKKSCGQSFLNRLNQMIKFIEENYDKVKSETKPIAADFVCTRGVLKKIMEFKYFPDNFKMYTLKLKGTIYIALEYDDAQFQNFGHEFEKRLLTSKPDSEPGETEGKEFCVVVERIVDDFKILFNVECDGIESNTPVEDFKDLKDATLVELKTRIDKQKFRDNKHFAWLIQSHVAGIIDKIYEGRRDENAIVKNIIIHDLKELEDKGKEQKGYDLNQCYVYLRNFLNKVRDEMINVENFKEVFVYSFIKRGFYEELDEMSSQIDSQVKSTNWIPPPTIEYREFLPKYYIDFINNC